MAFCTVSISSGLVDSVYGNCQFPIKSYLEKRGEAFEQESLLKHLFRMGTSRNAVEGYTGETAMDDFQPVGESGSYPKTGFQEGFKKFLQNETWKQSFAVSKELVEDVKIGEMKNRANKLITSYHRTREKFGRAIYVGAISGKSTMLFNGKPFDVTSADGVNAFAKNHPAKRKGADQCNLFSDALSAAALGKMETRMQNITGDNGELLDLSPDTIWIPNDPELKEQAFAAVGSNQNPMEQSNAYNYQYGRWTILVDPYLTKMLEDANITDKPWFLLDSRSMQEMDGPIWQDRVKLEIRSVQDDSNDNNLWLGRGRFAAGFGDWRCCAVGGMTSGSAL